VNIDKDSERLKKLSSIKKQEQEEITCGWCSQKLGTGYFFKCKSCSATYCYIHKDRHVCTVKTTSQKQRKSRRKVTAT